MSGGRVVLVHGGLYEGMDAERFWVAPGVVRGLEARGWQVDAPDRVARPRSWVHEADHLTSLVAGPGAVVAGSNGCSAAVRLAIDHRPLVTALVLCWPATCGDADIDAEARAAFGAAGVHHGVVSSLLGGDSLRGVADAELRGLAPPVAVVPSDPENRHHQRRTVDALLDACTDVELLGGCPEAPSPRFPPHADCFLDEVDTWLVRAAAR